MPRLKHSATASRAIGKASPNWFRPTWLSFDDSVRSRGRAPAHAGGPGGEHLFIRLRHRDAIADGARARALLGSVALRRGGAALDDPHLSGAEQPGRWGGGRQ